MEVRITASSSCVCPRKQNLINVGTTLRGLRRKHAQHPLRQALKAVVKNESQANTYDPRDVVERHRKVSEHFPEAMCLNDFMSRVEIALAGFGFSGDNTIAMVNLCRDEVTQVLKDNIECIFGSSFNTHGLGGVLTCGVTGMKAGLSHSPVCKGGRERYVFFAFPHISISSDNVVGEISRPGRPARSCACGALAKILSTFSPGSDTLEQLCRVPGVHNPLEPEYSILKQRLARRLRYEHLDAGQLDLCKLTQLAERTITDDLEYLIEKAVDPAVSDYAVVTGIQIHNWASELVPDGAPSFEFVAPAKCYTVVKGKKRHVNLQQIPPLSPRQTHVMGARTFAGQAPRVVGRGLRGGLLSEVPLEYLVKKLGGNAHFGALDSASNGIAPEEEEPAPLWQERISSGVTATSVSERDPLAPTMDSPEPAAPPPPHPTHPSFETDPSDEF